MDISLAGRSLHRRLAIRLAVVWILLSASLGYAVFELENRRIDDYVFGLATQAARLFNERWNALSGPSAPADRDAAILALLPTLPFHGVRVVSRDGAVVLDTRKPDSGALVARLRAEIGSLADFALADFGKLHHYKMWSDGRLFVVCRLPLVDAAGQQRAAFEGVYEVDTVTVRAIRERVRNTLLLVVLVAGATSGVLYPVVISLNRATLRLSQQLLGSNLNLMRTLGSAIAKRDSDTDSHNYRVTLYAIALAEATGLPDAEIRALIAGSFLHDVGKIGIPDRILLKPAGHSDEERAIMRQHVVIGDDILSNSEWLTPARDIVRCHHEWYDGSGYPAGLRGDAIPVGARIFAIVDVFDALTSKRPYKEPFPYAQAMEILRGQRARQLDPHFLDLFATIAPTVYQHFGGADDRVLNESLAAKMRNYFGLSPWALSPLADTSEAQRVRGERSGGNAA